MQVEARSPAHHVHHAQHPFEQRFELHVKCETSEGLRRNCKCWYNEKKEESSSLVIHWSQFTTQNVWLSERRGNLVLRRYTRAVSGLKLKVRERPPAGFCSQNMANCLARVSQIAEGTARRVLNKVVDKVTDGAPSLVPLWCQQHALCPLQSRFLLLLFSTADAKTLREFDTLGKAAFYKKTSREPQNTQK